MVEEVRDWDFRETEAKLVKARDIGHGFGSEV